MRRPCCDPPLTARLVAFGLLLSLLPPFLPSAAFAGDQKRGKKEEVFPLKKRELETLAKVADFERMLERHGQVLHDEELESYVTSVGERVIPAGFADRRLRFAFHVLRAPEANAFALPNGSIYVTLGLITLMENEAQLAAVLAHEVTHATHYHYFRFDRQYKAKTLAANLFAVAPIAGWAGLLASLGAQALYVGTVFGYSRDLEEEADRVGLTLLDAAGYDPAQSPASFRRLLVDFEGSHVDTPVFYSSHPKLEARVAYTEEQIAKTGLQPDPRRDFGERYAGPRMRAAPEEARLAIVHDLPRTAIAIAEILVQLRPDAAEPHHLRAEGFRALGYRRLDVTSDPPDDIEKKRLRREKRMKTPDELEKSLAESEEGRAAWAANAAAAERSYRKALELEPGYVDSLLGLALLHQKEGRSAEAREEVNAYLSRAPQGTLQRARAERLAKELEEGP